MTVLSEPRSVTMADVSPILRALYDGDQARLQELLAGDPDLDVFEAAALGRVERVEALIAARPDLVDDRTPDGFTALHLAAFFDHPGVVAALLARGADPGARAENEMAVEPLHSAAARSARAVAAQLLDAGADVNAQQHGGFTPLAAAAQNGDDALADLLVSRGADTRLSDEQGRDPEEHARRAGHDQLADRLAGEPGSVLRPDQP
jgi:ankyrin repeat protein